MTKDRRSRQGASAAITAVRGAGTAGHCSLPKSGDRPGSEQKARSVHSVNIRAAGATCEGRPALLTPVPSRVDGTPRGWTTPTRTGALRKRLHRRPVNKRRGPQGMRLAFHRGEGRPLPPLDLRPQVAQGEDQGRHAGQLPLLRPTAHRKHLGCRHGCQAEGPHGPRRPVLGTGSADLPAFNGETPAETGAGIDAEVRAQRQETAEGERASEA